VTTDERLAATARELAALVESGRALNATHEHQRLPHVIMRIFRRAFAAEAVLLLLVDEEGEYVVFEAVRGKRDQRLRGVRIPVGQGVAGTVVRDGKPLLVADARGDRGVSLALERKLGLRPRTILAVPLVHQGDVIGVVEAVNRRGNAPYAEHDLVLAQAVGEHIATAVAGARLRERLRRLELEYSLFARVSESMGKSLTLDEALKRILRNLKRLVPYDAAAIFVLDRERGAIVSMLSRGYPRGSEAKLDLKIDEGVVGLAARKQEGLIVDDVRAYELYVNARPRTRSEMVAPMVTRDRLIGLFNLENDRVAAYKPADLRLLQTFAAQAAASIERAHLYEEQQEMREIQDELRVARTVQEFFAPLRAHAVGGYRIAGVNFPSLEVSGDYYDHFPVRGGLEAFAIADVAGKGVPASIIMSCFRATLHTVAPYLTSARQIAARANQILLETVRPQDFVTAFIGVFDPNTGELTYCNAGHNPPFLMSPDGTHRALEVGGPVLGVFEDPPLQEGRLRVDDEVLVCYTDGAIEVRNVRDEEYGEARLLESLRGHFALTPHQLCRALHADLKTFIGRARQSDDITYLVLRRK